jgi:class 3 adenylate cyclase
VSDRQRLLVVDDTPHNVKLLADLLEVHGHAVETATNGREAIEKIERDPPDLVILDVVMPEMNGYEVCRWIRSREETRLLPVVMVTALDPGEERLKGIEAGADDFLAKPVQTNEVLARVKSLLRIRSLHETVRRQAEELADWNLSLEARVETQVRELRRLERLKGFFSPQIAEVLAGDGMKQLEPHRRDVTVVFIDIRGFTRFTENAEPEDLMTMLSEYHREMGRLVLRHEGTLERFTGDGIMIFFNDPIEVDDAEERAVHMALEMRDAAGDLFVKWSRFAGELGLGIGVANGYATLGLIGFEGRWDYAAIGTVTNRAARLCSAAVAGQVLVSDRLLSQIEDKFESKDVGEIELRGVDRAVKAHEVLGVR